MPNAIHFFDLTPETLATLCAELHLPRYSPAQILDWVYKKGLCDVRKMTNLSKSHREAFASRVVFFDSEVVAHQAASDGTQKLLLEWGQCDVDSSRSEELHNRLAILRSTDRQTECVMIPDHPRRTACLSSQIGCPVGCAFCASGLGGLDGNLTSGQIIEQLFRLNMLKDIQRISNVVFMGMGEPLANFQSVARAIHILNARWGFGIGARKITISTIGLPHAIRKLVNFDLPVTLALSLHAPNDELRRRLIPWADYTTIDDLLDSCDEYFQKTGREITLEYILLGGVNDSVSHARQLARIGRRLRSNVNLIRYNEVAGLPFTRPTTDTVLQFQETLRANRVNSHIRASRGRDISAACGQLRHESRGNEAAR